MNNDIIEIRDRFLIDDSHSNIRGFVSAYNEKNEHLFLKENMIVKSGRKLILDSLKQSIFYTAPVGLAASNDSAGVDLSNLKAYIFLNNNSTTPDMNVASLGIAENQTAYTVTDVTSQRVSDNKLSSEEQETAICLAISIPSNNGNAGNRWGSLALVYNDGENQTLFSRVTFPPYPQSANLTFYYYIYF